MKPNQLRLAGWLAVALSAILAIVLAKDSGQQGAVARACGWALLAAVGASLLLRVWGRRLVALLELGLGAGLVLMVTHGQGAKLLLLAAGLAVVGAAVQLGTAHLWPQRSSRFERGTAAPQRPTSDLEIWKALDAGLDPTADGFGDSLGSRETSSQHTRQPRPAASGADQEDQ